MDIISNGNGYICIDGVSIRETKEGLPCFDEFSKWALEQEKSYNWADIVALHGMVCNVVKNSKA